MNRLLLVCVALCIASLPVSAAPVLFGITYDETLIRIDTASGAGTLVGNLSSRMEAFGLGTRNNRLYAFDQNADLIRELSPVDASTLNSYDVGISTFGEGGLAFSPDGTGYLTQGGLGQMWSFNLDTLSSTFIGRRLLPTFDGLDFSPSGVLYGISQFSLRLYTLDITNGDASLIGETGLDRQGRFLAGLAFRPDGVLYAAQGANLYTIDIATGLATFVGSTGFDKISGLTFIEVDDPASELPEPATAMLCLSGGVLLLYRRIRRS